MAQSTHTYELSAGMWRPAWGGQSLLARNKTLFIEITDLQAGVSVQDERQERGELIFLQVLSVLRRSKIVVHSC